VADAEQQQGPANRLARSMMELVVGESRIGAAERVASAGVSIVEFVGAPVRRMLEPAFDARTDAAQDAFASLVELARVAIQEAIELVDVDTVLDRVDLDAVLTRIDLNGLLARIDVGALIGRVDLNALLQRVDVNDVVQQVDVAEILQRVDIDALLARIDVNDLMSRVDVEALLGRIDINQLVDQVDLDGIVERTEIGSLVVRSTSGIASEVLDTVRSAAVGVDGTVNRMVDRILRRRDQPLGPGIAPDPAT
jgi:hypothetical protein